jgi:hypothetical protein
MRGSARSQFRPPRRMWASALKTLVWSRCNGNFEIHDMSEVPFR